jgi:hypothetical protein
LEKKSRKSPKKTVIEPKVRLLLWICLKKKIKNESNYLKKLGDRIDYSEGSIKSHLIPELLRKNLIKSLSPDKRSPPYRATDEARKLLEPIFFVRMVALWFALFVIIIALALPWYAASPTFLWYWYFPLTVGGFAFLLTVLFLYPYFILKMGKNPFPE